MLLRKKRNNQGFAAIVMLILFLSLVDFFMQIEQAEEEADVAEESAGKADPLLLKGEELQDDVNTSGRNKAVTARGTAGESGSLAEESSTEGAYEMAARQEELDEKQLAAQYQARALTSRGGVVRDRDDIALLERVVMAEAHGEPYEGKVAVTNVIFNRVESSNFPNTVRGVLLQQGQFTPVATGRINNVEPTEAVKKAVREAVEGKRILDQDALYFLNPDIATCFSIPQTREFVAKVGSHSFYK